MRAILTAVAMFGFVVSASAADLKIGVVDPLKAISDTDVFKRENTNLTNDTAADKTRFEKLQGELNVCKQKLGTDAATMSATEQARMRTDCETKYRDYQTIGQNLQKVISERQDALLKDFQPKVQKAIEGLAKEGNFDMIVHRDAALFSKPELDVTAQVTTRLNAIK